MGRDFQSLHTPENKVADSFLAILEPTKEKMAFLAINMVLPQWFTRHIPWRLNQLVDMETGFLRDMCTDIVREKKAAIMQSGVAAKELEADILGTMMMGGDFSDSELVDQMLTFLAAGVSVYFPTSARLTQLNSSISMKLRPAPSLGVAICSPFIQTSRNAFAPKFANGSQLATPLLLTMILNQCLSSMVSARRSFVSIPQYPPQSVNLFMTPLWLANMSPKEPA